jgi:hypothetical protein
MDWTQADTQLGGLTAKRRTGKVGRPEWRIDSK